EAPVWKATYRIILAEPGGPGTHGEPGVSAPGSSSLPMIQGWAVVDNTLDEDWENVQLCLISGLPVSFVHDLYTPRYIHRPEVRVEETTGVLPPEVEEGMALALSDDAVELGHAYGLTAAGAAAPAAQVRKMKAMRSRQLEGFKSDAMKSSTPAQV